LPSGQYHIGPVIPDGPKDQTRNDEICGFARCAPRNDDLSSAKHVLETITCEVKPPMTFGGA